MSRHEVMNPGAEPLFGLMAEFDHPEDLVEATRKAWKAGYRKIEAYSPFPIEGLSEEMHFHTKLPWLILAAGIVGALSGFFLQYWVSVIDYPVNIGGRPLNSWPAWIPVTFEMTVLFAGLTAVIGMIVLNGLPEPYHPVFNVRAFDLATNDHFFLTVESSDPKFDAASTAEFLKSLNPKSVHSVRP
jgi:hypothetical protein